MENQSTQLREVLISNLLKPMQVGVMVFACSALLFSCSGDTEHPAYGGQQETGLAHQAAEAPVADDGKGIGPVKEVSIGPEIDQALATEGQTIYEGKCSACHQLSDQKVVGPGLADITERRKPEWVMNMIINPEEMTKKDPVAKKLLAEHLTQMTNQNVTEQDARAILEYLRQNDKNI